MKDYSLLRRHGSTAIAVLLGLTIGSGAMKAANLLNASPTSASLTCNTATGTPATTVVITPKTALTGSATLAVTYAAPPTGVTVSPASGTLSSTVTSLSFTVGLAGNCIGVTAGSGTLQFQQGNGAVNDVTAALTINAPITTASALVANPTTVNISCVYVSSGVYTYFGQNVAVSSVIPGGTPFTVTTANGGALPSWLAAIPGATAASSAAVITIIGTGSTCGGLVTLNTSVTTSLHLVTTGGLVPDKTVGVTLTLVSPTPLTANPASPTITYIKGSGSPGKQSVILSSSGTAFFAIDTSTFPVWLTADTTSGSLTPTSTRTISFSSTIVADTLVPGSYSASVRVNVSNYGALYIPITFLVSNPAPKLTVAEGQTRSIPWIVGQSLPTPVITVVSSGTPVPFTVTTAGALAPSPSVTQGLAYSFGTPVNVTFGSSAFASAAPGSILTGTVTITSGTPASNLVVTFNITVQSALATLSSVTPASLPTASTGTLFPMALTGSGFVLSSSPSLKTMVGIVPSGSSSMVVDTNISATVVDSSHINLIITANTTDSLLSFVAGGTFTIGVCNPTCAGNVPTGTATFTIGSNPIITAVTSSSTFVQASPQSVAPFDMLSIFGSNFCSSGGSGCSSSQILYGTPDAVLLTYPTTLNVDTVTNPPNPTTPCTGTQRCLSITFYTHGSTPPSGLLGTAPLLFATNSQINLLVPSGVGTTGSVDMYVNFGYGAAGSSTLHSNAIPYQVTIVPKDPGIFTIGADGQGSGAILNSNYALVGSSAPAGLRTVAADSDLIQIYMTGLGIPDSTGSGSTGAYLWSNDCVTPASFLSSFNTLTSQALTSLDGTIITPAALATGRLEPCFLSTDTLTVTVGGQPASLAYAGAYAGWAPGTVAGLYQLNVYLPPSTAPSGTFTTSSGATPTTISSPVQLPVVVTTAGGYHSQAGVTVWVAPKLKVLPPPTLTGQVSVPYSQSVVASESPSSSTITYALTSGLLPSGLALTASSGLISGTPVANTGGTYTVTVSAADSANVPVTGSVTFTLTIAGGLFMTSTQAGPFNTTFGTSSGTLTTVSATGGAYPYTYAITANSGAPPTGMVVSAGGAVSTSTLTPGGTYAATVTATDANGITGAANFTINEALLVTKGTAQSVTSGSASPYVTLTTTGYTTAPTYAITSFTFGGSTSTGSAAATSATTAGVAVNSSGVVSLASLASGTYSVTITATDTTAPGNSATGVVTVGPFTIP